MERKKRILHSIDIKNGKGLELGPLTKPILSKSKADVYYVDHIDAASLKKKYKDEPVELDKIVDVDFPLNGRSLPEAVGNKKFDYVLASHVFEHIPDPVTWLQDIEKVLHTGGILSLVIPDKRYTFDVSRRETLFPEIMGAYFDKLTRFTSAMVYDFAINCKEEMDTALAWDNPEKFKNAPTRWDSKTVNDMCRKNLTDYVDCHCFVYTPASFIEILRVLMEEKLLNYEIAYFLPTQAYELEFYVSLKKIDPKKTSLKQQLASLPKFKPQKTKEQELTEEVIILKQELAALKGSVSWRATKGLRKIRNLGKKLKS